LYFYYVFATWVVFCFSKSADDADLCLMHELCQFYVLFWFLVFICLDCVSRFCMFCMS